MTSRRAFLIRVCGAVSVAAAGTAAEAQLPPNIAALRKAAIEEAVRKVVGGARLRRGRVKLELPPLIENGNAVPLSVTVASPMTPADHVKAIHVFTEKNPQPNVISAWLGPRAGRAAISMRARIADTGTVIAIAQMSDGSFWSDRVEVVVTLSACLEDGLI
ncbi:MAG: SoxY-related AACIE arm protein [Betaproteobacteria bacterium]|nr:SoxY-related AACIE arm protein [Betaproteobacteria bacterium]MSQ89726.1 SoxY-related AACIE arm protein [Betaproteobacteria bacterium]